MSEIKRFRITVPAGDSSVIKWCESQYNLSFSIRALIKNAIACGGYTDVTCDLPGEKSPGTQGRPRKVDIKSSDMIFAKANSGALFNNMSVDEEQQIMMSDDRIRGNNQGRIYDMNSAPQGNPQQPVNNNYYQQQAPQVMQNPQPVNPSVNQPMNTQPAPPVNNNYNQPPAQQQMPMQPDNQQINTQQMPVTAPPVNNNADDDDDMAVFNFGR